MPVFQMFLVTCRQISAQEKHFPCQEHVSLLTLSLQKKQKTKKKRSLITIILQWCCPLNSMQGVSKWNTPTNAIPSVTPTRGR